MRIAALAPSLLPLSPDRAPPPRPTRPPPPSSAVHDTLNPAWTLEHLTFDFGSFLEVAEDTLFVELHDHDIMGDNDLMCKGQISLSRLDPNAEERRVVRLHGAKSGAPTVTLTLDAQLEPPVNEDPGSAATARERRQPGRVVVQVRHAKDLPHMERGGADPYVKMSMLGQELRSTTVQNSLSPSWKGERYSFAFVEFIDAARAARGDS